MAYNKKTITVEQHREIAAFLTALLQTLDQSRGNGGRRGGPEWNARRNLEEVLCFCRRIAERDLGEAVGRAIYIPS